MILYRLFSTVCWLLRVLIIIYCAISWLRIPENRWTTLLRRVLEPLLQPIRGRLRAILPQSLQILDFSPLVLLLACSLLERLVSSLIYRWI